ncbi:MAG: hypothetical protein WCY98_12355 [Castellaniella sp.]
MSYPVLLIIHLFAAIAFAGTVFFEVVMLEGVRAHLPREIMRATERAIGQRARRIMPWVLLLLYGAGIAMAWQHKGVLEHPLDSALGLLLCLKIVLAASVFLHFLTAMFLLHTGRMRSVHSRRIHLSIFIHIVLIIFLAKAMFYARW